MRFLITGGAGFIGANLAHRLILDGHDVAILDSLFGPESEKNLAWLRRCHGGAFVYHAADVRDGGALGPLFADRDAIIHAAAQTEAGAALVDPRLDFEINALGTLNCLDAARASSRRPVFLFTSTREVYGDLSGVAVEKRGERWVFRDLPEGIDETRPLDFRSPLGCSKGAADQYALEYARAYGVRTVVFRLGEPCGPRQFGTNSRGCVARCVNAAMAGKEIVVRGDGEHVRDILYIDDLIAAVLAAVARIDQAAGRVYNIGGGPANSVSPLELIGLLESMLRREIPRRFEPGEPGEPKVYITDTRRARADLGWSPRVSKSHAIERMAHWARAALRNGNV